MGQGDVKKLHGRAELIQYFKNGQIPNETHFQSLIDSVIIQHDDGISKDEENGYSISSIGSSEKLITFYKNVDRLEPIFYVEKDILEKPSLKFRPEISRSDSKEDNSFYFHNDGSFGIGKKSSDKIKLDVNGFTASTGRVGTYANNNVGIAADGKWHNITPVLDNCQAFEITARVGVKNSGKFSIMHATAVTAFGNSHSKIRKTRAYYGSFWEFWNKLNLRWHGSTHNFTLQMRTNCNFGNGVNIHYNICKLWDDALFAQDNCFYPETPEAERIVGKPNLQRKI